MPFKLGNFIKNLRMDNNKAIQGEAKFQALFNYAGDAIFMVDPSFQITDINESACKLVNYSREELLNKKMYELMTAGDQVTFTDWAKIINKKGGSVHERKLKRKDGSLVETEVNVRPVEGEGYISIIRDITERKKAEAKILERDSLLTALFNNIEGSIALYDADKKIVFFNSHFADNYKRLTGHHPKVGDGAHDFLSEEMKKDPAKMMDNALKGNKEVFEKDYLSNGKQVSFRTSFNPVINNGTVTGITSFSLDLTKSKEAEIKIRENEEKFRMAFMTGQDVFYIGTMKEGRIIDLNDSFYELFGYTREESIGKTTMELNIYAYPLDRARMIAELKAKGSLKDLELTCRKKNGELIIVSVTANVWQLNNESVLMAVIRDITENKRVEKELVESEIRFREVLENSLSASYKRNLQTNMYDYLSPVFKKIAGYTQDEINSLPLETVIAMMHPDDVETVNDGIIRAMSGSGSSENVLEYRFKHKTTGGYRWLQDEFVVIKDAKGQAISLIGSVSDITERKGIETELIESKEQMALFVEYSPASLAMFDNEMRYIATSRRWKNDYNLSSQDIIGKTHYEVFPTIPQRWKDIHQRCLQGAIEKNDEDHFTADDGTEIWNKWEIRPWRKASGEIGGIIMFTEVITGLKESELKFKNLVEKSLVGVYIMQHEKFVYVNPKFAKDLGYTQEEMLKMENGREILDSDYESDELIQWRKKADAGIIDDIHIELKYRKKNGVPVWAEMYCGETLYKGSKAILGTFQDITDRKNSEVLIKEQTEIFSAIIENTHESIWLLSPRLEVLQFNKTAKERLKLNRKKEIYIGADFKEFLHVGSEDVFMSMFNAAVTGKYPERESYQPDIDGKMFWLRTRMYPVYDTNKKLIGVTVLSENITERKTVEIALEQSEDKHRALTENISDAIMLVNENFENIYQSPSAERISGYTLEDGKGKKVFDFVYPKDREASFNIFQKAFNEPGVPVQGNFRIQHKLGHSVWIEGTVTNLFHNESIKAIIVNYRDITESKKATELFKYQFENSPDIILIINRNLTIESINRSRLNDLPPEKLIGKDSIEMLPEESRDNATEMILLCFETGKNQEIENTLRDNRWVRSRFVPMIVDGEISHIMIIATDITERKLAEEKLRASEEKNRALVENITDAIILIDENAKTIYRSPSTERITGFSFDEVKDKEVFEFVHPDHLASCIAFIQKTYTSPGVAFQNQFRIKHKLGHYIWVEGTLINLLHVKNINAFILNYRDITERKKLEEQQLLITSIVNSSDDAIISKSLYGIITSWNKGATDILGYTPEEAIGRHISMIIHPKLLREEEEILSSIRAGRSVEHFETKRRRKDGEVIDVSLTVSPIRNSSGDITGASKVLRDISERRKAEKRIKQSEANYRQLFDNSPAPMWVINEKTSAIVQVNQACIKNYGYSREEFVGMTIRDINPNYQTPGSKSNANDLLFIGSQRHTKRSGELIDVVTSSIPIILNGEKNILLTAIDVTEKNLYEQKLAKAAIKVQEDERYEIGGELHDNVCQLLVASLMLLGMIKMSLPEQAMEMYDEVRKHISTAAEEIRNLSHRLAPVFFDGETLEEALMGLLKTFNVENNYTISLVVDNAINERSLNRDLQLNLYRVLQEQLRNIMKHAQATDIKIKIAMHNDILQMRITDNGVGFDPQTKRGGIGLANMNRRVQLFSGNFTINSGIGNGCEVLVDIPYLPLINDVYK